MTTVMRILLWKENEILGAVENSAMTQKDCIFKSNYSFTSCISKINNPFIDNAGSLDIVLSMYNLLEYSENYSMTSGSLWNYYRDGLDDVNYNDSDGKSFRNKIKTAGKT